MSYLVGSDWVVDYLRGRPEAIALLPALAAENVGLSLLTSGEAYQGICYGAARARQEQVFVGLLRMIAVVDLNAAIMPRSARLRASLRKQGLDIGIADNLIAATALEYGLTLVTRNIRHDGRIPDLSLYRQPERSSPQ